MYAAFAERDITPELGMQKPGNYYAQVHEKFHDPCKVRAAVFSDGEQTVALVGIDALTAPRELVSAARARIESTCCIPADHVMVAASHSHSAGPVAMVARPVFDEADEFVRHLAYEVSSNADEGYVDLVARKIADAVISAFGQLVEVLCSVGSGGEAGAVYNRRFRMRNGLTYTHPGKGNPDIIEPAGPVDPEVGVIGAWRGERLIGCVVNYACHGTTGPGGTSADWIYYLERTIRGVYGSDVVVVFLNGASGDVTQVDNLNPRLREGGEEAARRVGQRVGAEALKVLATATPGLLAPIAATNEVLNVARRRIPPERMEAAWEMVRKERSECDLTEWTFAKETVLLDALTQVRPQEPVEVQVVQIGPAVFVSNPAEFFCQSGLDIKNASDFPFTWVVSLANGCVGYVPPAEAFGPHGGGYETRLTSYSNLEVTAEQQIKDAAARLISACTAGEIPVPDPAPFFKGPWAYGAVPPEPGV